MVVGRLASVHAVWTNAAKPRVIVRLLSGNRCRLRVVQNLDDLLTPNQGQSLRKDIMVQKGRLYSRFPDFL